MKIETTKLKPCPLCGCEVSVVYNGDYDAECDLRIKCPKCDLQMLDDLGYVHGPDKFSASKETAEKWNRRVFEARKQGRI